VGHSLRQDIKPHSRKNRVLFFVSRHETSNSDAQKAFPQQQKKTNMVFVSHRNLINGILNVLKTNCQGGKGTKKINNNKGH